MGVTTENPATLKEVPEILDGLKQARSQIQGVGVPGSSGRASWSARATEMGSTEGGAGGALGRLLAGSWRGFWPKLLSSFVGEGKVGSVLMSFEGEDAVEAMS